MPRCSHPRCDGHGWVTVLASYADQHLRKPPPEVWAAMTTTEREAWEREMAPFRESLAESVHPCQVCTPDAFLRWCGGHYDSRHDRDACDECNPKRGRKSDTTDHHRADLDLDVPLRKDLA